MIQRKFVMHPVHVAQGVVQPWGFSRPIVDNAAKRADCLVSGCVRLRVRNVANVDIHIPDERGENPQG